MAGFRAPHHFRRAVHALTLPYTLKNSHWQQFVPAFAGVSHGVLQPLCRALVSSMKGTGTRPGGMVAVYDELCVLFA